MKNKTENIIILGLLLIIFILTLIHSWDKFKEILKLYKQRAFQYCEYENRLQLDGKTYLIEDEIYGKGSFLLVLIGLIFSLLIALVILFIASAVLYFLNPEQDISILLHCIEILMPLLYSFSFGDLYTKAKENFTRKYLSLEELLQFTSYKECQEELNKRKQYLTKDEAEILNKYYFDNKKLPRDFEIIFKPKEFQIIYEQRQKGGEKWKDI